MKSAGNLAKARREYSEGLCATMIQLLSLVGSYRFSANR